MQQPYKTHESYNITLYAPSIIRRIQAQHFPDNTEEQILIKLINVGIEQYQQNSMPENPIVESIVSEQLQTARHALETSDAGLSAMETALVSSANLTEDQQEALTALCARTEWISFRAGFQRAMRLFAECGVTII